MFSLASVHSLKRHLQHDEKVTYVFRLKIFFFKFFFAFPFSPFDLLLVLLSVEEFQRKRHQDRKFLAENSLTV